MLPSRGRGCRLHGRRRCVGRCGERRGTATEGCVQLRHARDRRCDAGITPTAGVGLWSSSVGFGAASRCSLKGHTPGSGRPVLPCAWTLLSHARDAQPRFRMRELALPAQYSKRVPTGGTNAVWRCCGYAWCVRGVWPSLPAPGKCGGRLDRSRLHVSVARSALDASILTRARLVEHHVVCDMDVAVRDVVAM